MERPASGHTAVRSGATLGPTLSCAAPLRPVCSLEPKSVAPSRGRSGASYRLLTSQLLQELLLLGQMVPPSPQQYLRIKINRPVLFSCCAN